MRNNSVHICLQLAMHRLLSKRSNAKDNEDLVPCKRQRLQVRRAATRNKRISPAERPALQTAERATEQCETDDDSDTCESEDAGTDSCSDDEDHDTNRTSTRRATRYMIARYAETACPKIDLGHRNAECEHCGALNFEADRSATTGDFVICCHRGKVPKELFDFKYPDDWKVLISDLDHPLHAHFQRYIRHYNSSLSFTSMSAKLVNEINRGNQPYIFKVHGTTMHFSYNEVQSESKPVYSQCYFYDPADALKFRLNDPRNKYLDARLLENMDAVIRSVNPFCEGFKNMAQIEKELLAADDTTSLSHLSLEFYYQPKTDLRRWNAPTAQEIGAVYTTKGGRPTKRDFAIYPRSRGPSNSAVTPIKPLSNFVEPMTYAVFYPYGGLGWGHTIQGQSGNGRNGKVSQREFYAGKMMHRKDIFNPLLYGGRLFQQWVVDMKLMLDEQRMQFIRRNQPRLLVDQYKGLADWLENQAEEQGVQVWRKIVCPSGVVGSERWYREQYFDAMALVTNFGRPDLFITFTCNPDWDEIKNNLFPGQSYLDRPDLVAIAFLHRSKAFLDEVVKKKCFGKPKAWCYTIEFQKRGQPHMHLLEILENEFKITEPAHVDDWITAELPDPDTEPDLFKLITKCMIHGPCDIDPEKRGCRQQTGTCKKKYPQQFQNSTSFGRRGWPLYRRRKGPTAEITCGKRKVKIDNRWVVPYNKYLCQKFQCHINVEACMSVQSVKYVYKYIYKGGDRATVIIRGKNLLIYDEVQAMLDGKYLTASQAAWELFQGKTQAKSHAVKRLAVHLPDEQNVVFQEANIRQAFERASRIDSMLTAFFKLCGDNNFAKTLLYEELPQHFLFNRSTGVWRRSTGKKRSVTRIYAVNPRDTEKFYLRVLLLHVRGPTSYEFLRTVGGVLYTTFRDAAVALGLVENDNEWAACLQEACEYSMPSELRSLFAYILVFNDPKNPSELWNQFKRQMSEDFEHQYNQADSEQLALQEIEWHLNAHRSSLTNFGIEPPALDYAPMTLNDLALAEEVESLTESLNEEQRAAFDAVVASVFDDDCTQKCFFIDGPGGSGKTWTYRAIQAFLQANQRKVLALATTGIAADLLHAGRTMHSGFSMPLSIDETTTVTIRKGTAAFITLQEADVIIIDEASMMRAEQLNYISEVLKFVTNCETEFGGKILVLGGDFRQTLPVVKGGSASAVLSCVVKESSLWKLFKVFHLKINLRAVGHEDFCEWLLQIGEGRIVSPCPEFEGYIDIPPGYLCPKTADILNSVYGDSIQEVEELRLAECVVVTPKNKDAWTLNQRALDRIESTQMTFFSLDSVNDTTDVNDYPPEFLNAQNPPGMPPHRLTLKKGAVIMLLRNLQISAGLLNGTRLIIIDLKPHVIVAKILKGSKAGKVVFIPRIVCVYSDISLPFELKRRQFPVCLSYVMTINKSQGQSFDRVGVYLPNPVFSHGQLYVAFSRTRNPEHLYIQIAHDTPQHPDMKRTTANVVWKSVFRV